MLPIHRESAIRSRLDALSTPRSSPVYRHLSLRSFLRFAIVFGSLGLVFFYFAGRPGPAFNNLDWNRPPWKPQPPPIEHDWPPPPRPPHPPVGEPHVSAETWEQRAQAVKDAFLFAYHGYEQNAFPADELKPISKKPHQNFNSWGVSVVDALDTMILMNCTAEYQRAVEYLSGLTYPMEPGKHAPFFETVIRYLGGLLSAYHQTQEPILLSRADDLGRLLLPAFSTVSGLPMFGVNTQDAETIVTGWTGGKALLAEVASCQMEYKYLAHLTGRKKYFTRTDHIIDLMRKDQNPNGTWFTFWDLNNGTSENEHISVGAWADSGYEYLLKGYLLSGRREKKLLDMYLKAMSGVLKSLLYVSPRRELLYVTDTNFGNPTGRFEHLSCFFPGLLALGVHTLTDSEISARDRQLHRWAAHGLAHSCALLYEESPLGLGPEEALFTTTPADRWMEKVEAWERSGAVGRGPPGVGQLARPEFAISEQEYNVKELPGYLLRPETIETVFIMWKTTGEEQWRERGWQAFQAIEKHCRTRYGYASLTSVRKDPPTHKDEMPSYFLAETLKYLYLLFSEKDRYPLDRFVFTTEAHPLPVFQWRDWEVKNFGIS